MSLILEALRKLDRDRSAPDPGVVIIAAQPWPAGRSSLRTASVLLGALAFGAAGFWFGLRSRVAPSPAPSPAAASIAPPGSPSPREAPLGGPTARSAPRPGREAADRPAPVPAAPSETTVNQGPLETPADLAPTTPPPATGPADSSTGEPSRPHRLPTLHAITDRDGHKVALLDEAVVGEGDAFDGIRVIRIGEAEVEIEVAGRRHTLRF